MLEILNVMAHISQDENDERESSKLRKFSVSCTYTQNKGFFFNKLDFPRYH